MLGNTGCINRHSIDKVFVGLQTNNTLAAESALHAQTRADNDARLRPQINALQNGEALETLASMAKAYLGLYLDIDSSFTPLQRIGFLLSEDIANAVTDGFVAVLLHHELPTAEAIGTQMARGERYETGYIVLAAMDFLAQNDQTQFSALPLTTLGSAVCFHYANTSSFHDRWVEPVLKQHGQALSATLEAFQGGLIRQGTDHIPGLHDCLADTQSSKAWLDQMLLPVLAHWSGCKEALLNKLLQTAVRYSDAKKLSVITSSILTEQQLPPGKHIPWLATAFVLQPDTYWQALFDYTQRSKEKILPLLDFTIELVTPVKYPAYTLDHYTLARLLRLIAPKFPPHYDSFNNLTDNATKTLRLFYTYACLHEDISASAAWLQTSRVMKVVKDLLQESLLLNQKINQGNTAPTFEAFIYDLKSKGKLNGRRGRYG